MIEEAAVEPLEEAVVMVVSIEAILPLTAAEARPAYGLPLASVIEIPPRPWSLKLGFPKVVAVSGGIAAFVGSPPDRRVNKTSYSDMTKSPAVRRMRSTWM